ncbi:MAG: CocE/NonD family hydrolase [Candidatus Latescibacteria bacterium]|nr:CocE/NonD family hydrolase [Candidatus Latescibacterota bacterium]
MKKCLYYAMIFRVSLLLVPFVSTLFAGELSQPNYKVIEELDVRVTMRDGIDLSTNVYRPDAPGKFPALLVRTPYGNGGVDNSSGHYFAERRYVVVIQDTRGRYESEGVFYPVAYETNDGIDTHEWVIKQPWSNGKLGTFGGSYVGMTQWMPALKGSTDLVAMFTYVPYTEGYSVWFQQGALRLRLLTEWYAMMTAPYDFDEKIFMEDKIDTVNRSLPLGDQDKSLGWRMPFARDLLNHPEHDSYWEPMKYEGNYKNIDAAGYIVAGWYDLFTGQNLKSFMEMNGESIKPTVRSKQKLLVGPWGHGVSKDGTLGDLDFGKEAVIDVQELRLRWFDYHLKGIDTGIMDEPPVKIFVMGDNVWRTENEWPLKRTRYTKYYLHSSGSANSKDGDGSLNQILPKKEPNDSYVYDPIDPVPSMPDSTIFSDFRHYPHNHSLLEGRNDILVYTTSALKEDTEVTGPIALTLFASSSAVNTDFTGKLLDVYPDGRAMYLCDGIIRTSFRDGPTHTSNIESSRVYEYHIDLWATSNVFKKGHKIRIEISSSNFPRFDRNLNTGRNFTTETEPIKATQAIYHTKEYPSHIVLPVIPR